jgi:hypothetical protein
VQKIVKRFFFFALTHSNKQHIVPHFARRDGVLALRQSQFEMPDDDRQCQTPISVEDDPSMPNAVAPQFLTIFSDFEMIKSLKR